MDFNDSDFIQVGGDIPSEQSIKKFNLQIGKIQNFSSDQRAVGKIWPGYADTMIGIKRLDNIQHCIENVKSIYQFHILRIFYINT